MTKDPIIRRIYCAAPLIRSQQQQQKKIIFTNSQVPVNLRRLAHPKEKSCLLPVHPHLVSQPTKKKDSSLPSLCLSLSLYLFRKKQTNKQTKGLGSSLPVRIAFARCKLSSYPVVTLTLGRLFGKWPKWNQIIEASFVCAGWPMCDVLDHYRWIPPLASTVFCIAHFFFVTLLSSVKGMNAFWLSYLELILRQTNIPPTPALLTIYGEGGEELGNFFFLPIAI